MRISKHHGFSTAVLRVYLRSRTGSNSFLLGSYQQKTVARVNFVCLFVFLVEDDSVSIISEICNFLYTWHIFKSRGFAHVLFSLPY